MGLPLLVLYGLGNILGAGIYVLMGKVAGIAGYGAPISFALAFGVAVFTALTYMELTSRYPKTAAVSVYLNAAFGKPTLSAGVGLLLVGAGIVSAATLAKGFAGYFAVFVPSPAWLVITLVVGALTGLAIAGISQSARLAAASTVVEVIGLGLVIWAGSRSLDGAPALVEQLGTQSLFAPGVILGGFIAFYAFLGFEDMVEVVEEVKNPLRNMPRAILLSLVLATVLYVLVLLSALLVLAPEQLAASSAPLADVFATATGLSPRILAGIGLAAIINGILVQLVMGSRILYGLASRGWIHRSLGKVDEKAQTPLLATAVTGGLIWICAVTVPLVRLAEFTSFLVLIVFGLVNVALVVIKRSRRARTGIFSVPMWVPAAGVLSAFGMLGFAFIGR